jgi:hypothetical protein
VSSHTTEVAPKNRKKDVIQKYQLDISWTAGWTLLAAVEDAWSCKLLMASLAFFIKLDWFESSSCCLANEVTKSSFFSMSPFSCSVAK